VVHERIANLSASTFSFGAGLAWEPAALQGARMSLAAQNLGPAAHYIIDGAPGAPVQLPAGVQGGVSYALPFASSYTLRTALEARMTRGQPGVAMLGGELAAGMGAAVRVGFRLNDTNSQFGAGVGYATRALHLDYAYVPSGLDIGDTHRFSLSTRF
jgi:hypothetical protein